MAELTRTAVLHVETPLNYHPKRTADSRLAEAVELALAIDLEILWQDKVRLRKIDAGLFLSLGHLEEMAEKFAELEIELVFINHHLSPIQQRNLERKFQAKVIDRTGLILEIFGARAETREGVLQVQHAHLKYQKSRLVRSWTHLERQRGGRGFLGGPGETQIEADRRAIDEQIIAIEQRLEKVRQTRELQRVGRKRNHIPVVALVGYTNAGKSTLFNKISGADALAKDMLFATLDPTMRQVVLPLGLEIVLSDTVGFISDLPTELVAAFRATLEEVLFADAIIHVRDISNPEHKEQAEDVYHVLDALGVDPARISIPFFEVYNKIDMLDDPLSTLGESTGHLISAKTGAGVTAFLSELERVLKGQLEKVSFLLDYQYAEARAWLFEHNLVRSEIATEKGYVFEIEWGEEHQSRFFSNFGPILIEQSNE